MPEAATLVLHAGRERSLLRRHPWIFSGAVRELRGAAAQGDTVRVCSADGSFLAWAAYNASSRITARVWDFSETARIDREFFARRLSAALTLRRELLRPEDLHCARLVHAESDALPGLVVDRFSDQLVLQATSAGAARDVDLIAEVLSEVSGVSRVYERSEGDALELEGLPARTRVVAGADPDVPTIIEERGLRFVLDVRGGHKTGFYLDQRDNRALVRSLAQGRDVLDAFCYSGGFGISAALGGAHTVCGIDASDAALALARDNAHRNGVGATTTFERADVFEWLRKARDRRQSFDLIVLDPPKFAPTVRSVERAARAYKDVNLLAFKLLRPGGLLLTFSCSSGVSPDLFQKIVAGAAADARVDAAFLRRLSAGPDHPVALGFPEGEYLKGLLCRVS